MEEKWLLDILKENPNLSLNYSKNGWFFTGATLRDIKIPEGLLKAGYEVSSKGIYKDSAKQATPECFATFCLD